MYKFKRWLKNWLDQDDYPMQKSELLVSEDSNQLDSDRCVHLRVWFAQGGKVIQTTSYDRNKDRSNRSLYVFNEEHELGHELSKIITLEAMKL
jgi:hypothetical protein